MKDLYSVGKNLKQDRKEGLVSLINKNIKLLNSIGLIGKHDPYISIRVTNQEKGVYYFIPIF